jgi:hypothetical protein
MINSEIWGPIHEIGQYNEIWGPIHEIGQWKADAQPSTLEAQTVTSKVLSYMNGLLKECLEGMEGVSTDTIHLGDFSFVVFVLARH